MLEIIFCRSQRRGRAAYDLGTTSALLAHQPCALQNLQMLGDGGECERVMRRDFADCHLASRNAPQHIAPRGVGERLKHLIELLSIFNHIVEYYSRRMKLSRRAGDN